MRGKKNMQEKIKIPSVLTPREWRGEKDQMKKRLFLLLCMLIPLVLIPSAAASSEFFVPSLDLISGNNLTLTLSLNGIINTTGISYGLFYNNSVIQIDSIVNIPATLGVNAYQ
jgi:hypothetical protein